MQLKNAFTTRTMDERGPRLSNPYESPTVPTAEVTDFTQLLTWLEAQAKYTHTEC